MRNLTAVLFMLLCASAFAQQQTPPIINFESVPDPLQLPDNMYFGEVSGIAVNSEGHVFVLSRNNTTGPAYAAAAAQLLEFDADGKFLREIGHNLYAWSFAHMVKIDRHDNIWVTDKGSDMVIKFTPEGRVAMVFGRKQEASDEETGPLKHPNPPLPSEPGRFRQVTDTAFDAADNTFISDGYISHAACGTEAVVGAIDIGEAIGDERDRYQPGPAAGVTTRCYHGHGAPPPIKCVAHRFLAASMPIERLQILSGKVMTARRVPGFFLEEGHGPASVRF